MQCVLALLCALAALPAAHHTFTLPCLSLDMPPPTCLEACGHKLSPHMPLWCPLI
ncbi:hypothetical protein PVL29_002187 [Vitis rotundifolia]|uniref:Uncharacterized protein n=1 Tax=Vitis rotundifolia TaxID=103349 RepID=A0AA39AIY3_VITRO|nr:hypothetical protein PVL29_002187 [Vitis rotundifolia]